MNQEIYSILHSSNIKIDPGMISDDQARHLVSSLIKCIDSGVDGDVVELGCNVGESSKLFRKTLNRFGRDKKLWVYDSFEGLPLKSKWEEGTPWQSGTLKTDKETLIKNFTQNNLLPPDVIVKSWFNEIKDIDLPEKICFAFLDGDFYDSIYDSLIKVYDRVSDGGYILFHDYKRTDLPGVKAAVEDFLESRSLENNVFTACDQLGVLVKREPIKNKKLGFLHIPRTGGTHLERVLNPLGPDKFINLFGANQNQRQNHIPIIESMKPGDSKNQMLLSNPNLETCKLFAGHFSHNIKDCFNEEVDFFTILRDPIQRVISLSKQFLTSREYREILSEGSQHTGDEKFYENLFKYLTERNTKGLLTHEVHGFSDYMTKVIAGCDISDPNIKVDHYIFDQAVKNLRKMKFFSFFEDYNLAVEDTLTTLCCDLDYSCGPLNKSNIPQKLESFLKASNSFDIKLYKVAKEIQQYRSKKNTFVTALVNIGRDSMSARLFQRKFETYLMQLKNLIKCLKNQNFVIYIEPEYLDKFSDVDSKNIIFKTINKSDIENSEYYNKIQKIRKDPNWYGSTPWLSKSPQAQLDLYNPLIFHKIHLLNHITEANPFNDYNFYWIDAGILNAQSSKEQLDSPLLYENLSKDVDKFIFINYPYKNYKEIHGFSKEGFKDFYDGDISSVTRATFFGGRPSYIKFFSDKFREIAHKSLDKGFMGTEESIFTILNYLYPKKINSRQIEPHGLVRSYFNSLINQEIKTDTIIKPQTEYKPTPYKGVRNQQNPKSFDLFQNFFKENNDIELVIEIGSGFGGFSSFLKDQSIENNFKFISYESNENKHKSILSLGKDIDCRNSNAITPFTLQEISDLLNSHKKSLILCDGDNIKLEFNRVSSLLKTGDIVMAHDYAPNKDVFENEYKGKIWDWLEISDIDIKEACEENNLKDFYSEFNKTAWLCKQKEISTPDIPKKNSGTNLYILTFNFPEQLLYTIKTLEATPKWLESPNLFLLDNSDNDEARQKNQKIAKDFNFEYISLGGNKGICGGRQFAAEHFDKSDAEFMLFFEDDMTLNCSKDDGKFCRNGFRKYVPNLYDTIHNIMIQDKFDFLKLSFTEVYFDNDKQCSWYNVPQETRTKYWPHYDKLPETGLDPNVPLTDFKNIRKFNDCSYIDGEVYYANWPTIVSKSGNKKMFIETKWNHPYEQTWMSYMFKKTKEGLLRPAVLLASPITHNRFKHYKPEERREN